MPFQSRALVLGAIRWRESSKIVTLYTEDKGKIKVIARGALRSGNPFGGRLETLNELEIIVSWKQGRELNTLTKADLLQPFAGLRNDIDRLGLALTILELINKLIDQEHAEPVFYDFTVTILQSLEKSPQPMLVFWYFLLKLASFLGFKPDLQKCASCGKTAFSGLVRFSMDRGAAYCSDCAGQAQLPLEIPASAFNFLQRLQQFPHRRLAAFPETTAAAGGFPVTRWLLDYLNHHLDITLDLQALQMLGNGQP